MGANESIATDLLAREKVIREVAFILSEFQQSDELAGEAAERIVNLLWNKPGTKA